MKIHVASDFHTEMQEAPKYRLPKGAGLVLLAGDIAKNPARSVTVAHELFPDVTVLTVAGNHEFYGGQDVAGDYLGVYKNVQRLDNSYVHFPGIGGPDVVVLGCTLWTDFMLDGDEERSMKYAERAMFDYSQIRHGNGWLAPKTTKLLYMESVAWLDKTLGEMTAAGATCIVMTHHAPSPRSVAHQFFGSPLNPAFASDLEWLMFKHKPALWVHGHVHSSHDYMVGQTRVVANPRGYETYAPGVYENPNFNPNLIIEV